MKARLVVLALAIILTTFRLLAPRFLAEPVGQFGGVILEATAKKTLGELLDNQLPLKLDANAIYPTVNTLPGGTFRPTPLRLTADEMDKTLPPGDYTMLVLAFCTEYSVHRPSFGAAYELGPIQGKAAGAISTLLWRGTIEKRRSPAELQAVAWAIESGLRYTQMPKTFQAIIDDVIPDHKGELNGDFFQNLEDTYQVLAKQKLQLMQSAALPPLDKLLLDMGKPGQLALSARRQREALLRQNTTDQIRTQILFAGQDRGVATPIKAAEGPWTERIPGVAYVRYKIVGGNMASNNVMEIRILPQRNDVARTSRALQLVLASYRSFEVQATAQGPSPAGLASGSIGYPYGIGAQVLVPVPVAASRPLSAGGSGTSPGSKPGGGTGGSSGSGAGGGSGGGSGSGAGGGSGGNPDPCIAGLFQTPKPKQCTVITATEKPEERNGAKNVTIRFWAHAQAVGCVANSPPSNGMKIEAAAPLRGEFQFLQFVWHYSKAGPLSNPITDRDPCTGKTSNGQTPDSNNPKDACYFIYRDPNIWYVDARGLGLPGQQQQDPDYLKGSGAASCVTTTTAAMFDAPSSPAKFVTVVLYNSEVVGVVHWVSTGSAWTFDDFTLSLEPPVKDELCSFDPKKIANIMDYKPGLLAAMCK